MVDTWEDVQAVKQLLEGWKSPELRERWFNQEDGFFRLTTHWCEAYFW